MKILFVDDEANVLEGIENRLRKYRNRWDMSFSLGGERALELMGVEKYDAVVSDMRMPGMDGVELLGKVRENYSDVIRIVLTGQTAKEQILRSLSVAHKVLNKPCDALLLDEAIGDAQILQNLVGKEEVRLRMDKIDGLPTLPKLHSDLTQVIKSGEAPLDKISEIICTDPVISTRVLQLVNSGFLGLTREIVDINEAVVHFGLECIRCLILKIELFKFIEGNKLSPSFCLDEFGRNSRFSASLAYDICENKADANLVYSGALLHGIGGLVLAHILPLEYEKILKISSSCNGDLTDIEMDELGFTNADVSAYLLNLWDLPFSIVNVVGNCQRPSLSNEANFGPIGVVHVATTLSANKLGILGSSGFDMSYLDATGKSGLIGHWSSYAEEQL